MLHTRKEYPRPQFRREKWQNLNGEWQFAFDDNRDGELNDFPSGKVVLNQKINVPFAYQCKASGIGDPTNHDTVWYRRTFKVSDELENKSILLCFNGCDYFTSVWVNGNLVITHKGAYSGFKADITKYLRDENVIVVKCEDTLDMTIPRGKQSFKSGGKPFGCWYIPTTGIWQSVWLEAFGEDCIDGYSLFSDIHGGNIYGDVTTLYGKADKLKILIDFAGKLTAEHEIELSADKSHTDYVAAVDKEKEIRLWSTDEPNLYGVTFILQCGDKVVDVCHARIGMREISVSDGKFCINGKPFYQRLVLDQGYWQDTDLTPPSAEALKNDIILSKKAGFNGARKHQKIEDSYYNYYAEELGFITWCEMPSAYDYCDKLVQNVSSEWSQIVAEAKNATSVICYVPFNESWGIDRLKDDKKMQSLANALYFIAKSLDPTRIVSTNDGWENPDNTDIVTIHDYSYDAAEFESKYIKADINTIAPANRAQFANGSKYRGQPILFTEFGGIAMQTDAKDGSWGYGVGAEDSEAFYNRVKNLIQGIMRCPFQGYCFTQLTDVQQEVNGLLDSRHNPKFDIGVLNEIFNCR